MEDCYHARHAVMADDSFMGRSKVYLSEASNANRGPDSLAVIVRATDLVVPVAKLAAPAATMPAWP